MTSLNKWAKDALAARSDNPVRAAAWLVVQSMRDRKLKDNLLRVGADQLVRNYFRDQRKSAFRMAVGRVAANLDNPATAERTSARIARQKFWDSYTLFGMTPIRDATRAALLESVAKRTEQAKGDLRCAAFEKAVSFTLKNDKIKVCEAMTDEELQKLAAKCVVIP
jgi:hypothetical protein